MRELLRADFYRLFKSKLVIVSVFLAAGLPLVTAALFLGLREFIKYVSPEEAPIIELALNAHTLLGSAFSYTNNFGLILPVFAAILIMSDVNSGTIRNKIILGHSRPKIFAAHFITSMAYCVALITIYFVMTLAFGSLFLGLPEISSERLVSYVYFVLLGLIGYAFVASIATSLSMLTLSNAPSILLTLLFTMGFGLMGQLIVAFDYSSFEHLAHFIPGLVGSAFQSSMGLLPREITPVMFLEGLGGYALFGGAFYALGLLGFLRKDLK